MERVQKDVNASMRAILIDWLVEVEFPFCNSVDVLYELQSLGRLRWTKLPLLVFIMLDHFSLIVCL